MRGEAGTELYRKAMLRELAANHYKGGWDEMTRRKHFREIEYHLAKLKAAVASGDQLRIIEYGADVGNHVWFLLEYEDVLTPEKIQERADEPSFVAAQSKTYLLMARYKLRFFWQSFQGLRKVKYERHPEPPLDGFG